MSNEPPYWADTRCTGCEGPHVPTNDRGAPFEIRISHLTGLIRFAQVVRGHLYKRMADVNNCTNHYWINTNPAHAFLQRSDPPLVQRVRREKTWDMMIVSVRILGRPMQ